MSLSNGQLRSWRGRGNRLGKLRLGLASLATIALVSTDFLAPSPSSAIRNGQEATGTVYASSIVTTKWARTSQCTATMVSPKVAVTAAHCVYGAKAMGDGYITQPGVNVATDDLDSRVRIAEVGVMVEDSTSFWKDWTDSDLAFLVVEKPIPEIRVIRIPNSTELREILTSGQEFAITGYGHTEDLVEVQTGVFAPASNKLNTTPHTARFKFEGVIRTTNRHIIDLHSTGFSPVCSGDSGAGAIARLRGEVYLIGVVTGGWGCRPGLQDERRSYIFPSNFEVELFSKQLSQPFDDYLKEMGYLDARFPAPDSPFAWDEPLTPGPISVTTSSPTPEPTPTPRPTPEPTSSPTPIPNTPSVPEGPGPNETQLTLAPFPKGSKKLNALQKIQIKTVIQMNPDLQALICTGLRFGNSTRALNLLVRQRSKAACDYAKALNPKLRIWFQSQVTGQRAQQGLVQLNFPR